MPLTPIACGPSGEAMGDGTICKSCLKEIEDGEPWHYRYKRKAGLFEPVHDKCVPPDK